MVLAPETQKIVDGLTSLKETIQKKGQVETEIKRSKAKIEALETDAKNSGEKVRKLPTDNCEKTKVPFRSARTSAHKVKEQLVNIALNALIVILGILMIVTLFSRANSVHALSSADESAPTEVVTTDEGEDTSFTDEDTTDNPEDTPEYMAAIFSVIATISLLVYANIEAWSIYDDISDVFCLSGILFFIFCWATPAMSIVYSTVGLAQVNAALIAIPIIMVVSMVIRKHYKRNGMKMKFAPFTKEEKAQIDAAAALDRENEQKNLQMMQEAVARRTEEIRQPVAELNEKIAHLQAELSTLTHQIDNNDYLAPKQLENLDKILHLLRYQEADTIKEAINKIEEEKRFQIMLEEQRREKIRQEEEYVKHNSPGTVTVQVTEDGKGKNADVYVDGQYYGNISYLTGTTFLTLNPGAHNVAVIVHSCGQSFRSAPHGFNLEGGSNVTLKFSLLAYLGRVVCTQG